MIRSVQADGTARAFVAFGANLGDPASAWRYALEAVAQLPGTAVIRHSSLYRTEPIGVSGQPDYVNAAMEVETLLTPQALLAALLNIETQGGRTRASHRAPRHLDLDLLLYGEQVITSTNLVLPHPRMHKRAFVLIPLTEIAPDLCIPGRGPISSLLPEVAGQAVTRL